LKFSRTLKVIIWEKLRRNSWRSRYGMKMKYLNYNKNPAKREKIKSQNLKNDQDIYLFI